MYICFFFQQEFSSRYCYQVPTKEAFMIEKDEDDQATVNSIDFYVDINMRTCSSSRNQ